MGTFKKKNYNQLTSRQKADIANGCGGKGGYVKPPHSKLFEADCHDHDLLYFYGHKEIHRTKADFTLRALMRLRIKNTNIVSLRDHLYIPNKYLPGWLVRQIYYRWADIYYTAVVAVGWKYFYYADQYNEV